MTVLILVNDAPYATERPYNALRLASAFTEDGEATVRLFFMGDGAWCAVKGQPVPEGRNDMDWMLRRFLGGGRKAAVCGTCMDQRGIRAEQLAEGAYRSTLQELKTWVMEADRVVTF